MLDRFYPCVLKRTGRRVGRRQSIQCRIFGSHRHCLQCCAKQKGTQFTLYTLYYTFYSMDILCTVVCILVCTKPSSIYLSGNEFYCIYCISFVLMWLNESEVRWSYFFGRSPRLTRYDLDVPADSSCIQVEMVHDPVSQLMVPVFRWRWNMILLYQLMVPVFR